MTSPHREQNRVRSQEVFRCAPGAATTPAHSNTRSTSTGRDRQHMCATQERTWGPRRDGVRECEKKKGTAFWRCLLINCFQARHNLHFLRDWVRSLILPLLRRAKGETPVTGSRAGTQEGWRKCSWSHSYSSVQQFGVIKASPSWLQKQIREGELFRSAVLENKRVNNCRPDNNCELRKL